MFFLCGLIPKSCLNTSTIGLCCLFCLLVYTCTSLLFVRRQMELLQAAADGAAAPFNLYPPVLEMLGWEEFKARQEEVFKNRRNRVESYCHKRNIAKL